MQLTEVTVSRVLEAARPIEVFDAWLDPDSPGGPWFGCERVLLHPAVDGLFYHSVRHDGRTWAHYGRFVRLVAGRLIEHTWVSEATRGIESTVTITLAPEGDDTLFTLRHHDLPDDEMGRRHADGWRAVADAMAARFAMRRGG